MYKMQSTALPNQNSFAHLKDVLSDAQFERQFSIQMQAPSRSDWQELVDRLSRAAEFLKVSAPLLDREAFRVLKAPLDKRLVSLAEALFVPRYAQALELDEAPRDNFTFAECGEEMRDVQALAGKLNLKISWSSVPFNAACGEYGGKPRIFWLRAKVADTFLRAVQAFNAADLRVHVEDCFRPEAVQRGLFARRIKLIQEENSGLTREQILMEARAKTASAPYRAAHMGGAAVDFTLKDLEGRPLDLGNPYPTGGASAILEFPYVTWAQFRTRKLFACISEMAGLSPYPGEDWHVSIGDGMAGLLNGETLVRYCAISDFDRLSGKIKAFTHEQLFQDFPVSGLP